MLQDYIQKKDNADDVIQEMTEQTIYIKGVGAVH